MDLGLQRRELRREKKAQVSAPLGVALALLDGGRRHGPTGRVTVRLTGDCDKGSCSGLGLLMKGLQQDIWIHFILGETCGGLLSTDMPGRALSQ